MPVEDLIRIENLSKKFISTTCENIIFSKANLNIKKNSVVGISGKNGSGKTTLIKIISGILLPDEGKLFFQDKKIHNNDTFYREKISFLGDGNRSLYWNLTGEQNIKYFFELNFSKKKLEDTIYKELILRFEMEEYINQQVETYSKGMKQKLLLVISLLKEPELLIMDEPLNGLDSESILVIEEMIRDFSKYRGTTFLLTSHDKDFLEKNCSEIFDIKNYGFHERKFTDINKSEIRILFRKLDKNFDNEILKKANYYSSDDELYSFQFDINNCFVYKELFDLLRADKIQIHSLI